MNYLKLNWIELNWFGFYTFYDVVYCSLGSLIDWRMNVVGISSPNFVLLFFRSFRPEFSRFLRKFPRKKATLRLTCGKRMKPKKEKKEGISIWYVYNTSWKSYEMTEDLSLNISTQKPLWVDHLMVILDWTNRFILWITAD